jgi:uncharacterized protein with HEPN domain
LEHLRAAVKYADRGTDAFFDAEVPDTYLLVEGELRMAYESLNRLGQSFCQANPRFDQNRIGEVRQRLTHDYSEVGRNFVWKVAEEDAPGLIHLLTRAKIPRST